MKISILFKKKQRIVGFGVFYQMDRLVNIVRQNTTITLRTIFEIGANLADDGVFLAKQLGVFQRNAICI